MSSTLRQRIAVSKLSEIIGNSKGQKNISMGRILREAGYSDQTSKTPQLVIGTRGFQDELARVIPDETIVKTHRELIGASKLNKMAFDASLSDLDIKKIIEWPAGFKVRDVVRKKGGNQAMCYYWSPDGMARLNAIDMAYKIKNLYPLKGQIVNDAPIVVKVINYGSKKIDRSRLVGLVKNENEDGR